MRRNHLLLLASALLLSGSSAACVQEVDDNPLAGGSDDGWDFSDAFDEELDEPIAPDTGLEGGDAPSSDVVVEAALLDVEAFWDRSYESTYGTPYEPIDGGFWAYGPDTEQPPSEHLPRPTPTSPRTPSTARTTISSRGTTSTWYPGSTRSSAASPSASCSPTSSVTPSRREPTSWATP